MATVILRYTALFLVVVVVTGLTNSMLGWAGSGNPTKGKSRYKQYCAVCHGALGRGDGPMAKATTPPAPRLTSREVREKSDKDLLNVIAEGRGGSMPAWRGILNDQELLDMVAYVRSLSG
ncbi:MAG: c-type cytochrome [Nitrospiraceae bacterium]